MIRPNSPLRVKSLRSFLLAAFVTISASAAGAKATTSPGETAESSQSQAEEPVEPGSPRAALTEYLRSCRSGNYAEASRYLDVPPAQASRAPILAKRLTAVIDQHGWPEMDSVSPLAIGDTRDGLPTAYEAIAKIPIEGGRSASVKLYRRATIGGSPAWVVSRNTVEHVDGWYEELPQRWQLEHFPAWMLRPGPKELLVWQWIALPVFFALAWGLGELLSKLTRRVVARVTTGPIVNRDDPVLKRLRGPLALVWALVVVDAALPLLGLYVPAEQFVSRLLHGGFVFALFWSLSRLIELWGRRIAESAWANERASAKSLVTIGVRLAKILLLVVAVVVLVTAMGYPAASIVAGLGVGGLAVALAAQKTLENLLGAFTLGLDQLFQVGDLVKVEDVIGNVESIGLRSTRIRTAERTLITIPNGRLSELRLESFAARDRIRFACNLALAHGTSAAQMREVLSGCEQVLVEQPKICGEGTTVRLKELGESGLVIEIQAWFDTVDYAEFQAIREGVLLSFMELVERAGTNLASPSRMLLLSPSNDGRAVLPSKR